MSSASGPPSPISSASSVASSSAVGISALPHTRTHTHTRVHPHPLDLAAADSLAALSAAPPRHVKVVLTGPTDDALPVEYEGTALVVPSCSGPFSLSLTHTHTDVRVEDGVEAAGVNTEEADAIIDSVVKLAQTTPDGPELLRHLQRASHVQFLRRSDHSYLLPQKFRTLPRVGRAGMAAVEDGVAKGPGGAVSASINSLVPEVMWKEDAVCMVADGTGVLRDALTGATLYDGAWRLGLRHGTGKATIHERRAVGSLHLQESKDAGPAVLVGEYDGDWRMGLRHGRGVLAEDCGDKYEGQWALDMQHGQGTEFLVGGGVFKGNWHRGRKHGCGSFLWPAANRTELREYDHGALVAVRLLDLLPRTSSQLALAALPPGAVVQRSASAHTLHSPIAGEESEGQVFGLAVDHAAGAAGATALGDAASAAHLPGLPPSTTVVTIPLPMAMHAAMPRPNASVIRFLKHSSVNDVPGGRAGGDVITVDVKDPVESCITRMTENNVLSVPVYDKTAERFVAIVHILDIFAFMLDLVSKKKATFSPSGASLRETLAHQRRFATAPIAEVLEMSSHICPPVFKPLPLGAPLFYAVQILADGAHAVPIMDTSGRIVRMLTQADVVRFLAQHLDELQPMGNMTIGELGLGAGANDRLVVARFTDRAFDILQALRAKQSAAAPVVDNYGAMAANISFSDVKAIARKANFSALQLPISQFFNAIEKGSEVMSPSIYVKATTQFQSMVLTLAATKIHQLYFVDEELHPVGCVRVGDVLQALIKEDVA